MPKPQVRRPPIPIAQADSSKHADPPNSSISGAAVLPRLGIPLTADKGAIDWSTMRESTREKLVALVTNDPRFRSSPETSATPPPEIFTDRWCATMLDAFGKLEQSIVSRAYHVTMEQAAVMLYDDDDKRIITGPLQRVLNKYAGSWLSVYTDETALLLALGTVHIEKLQRLRETVERAQRPHATVVSMPSRETETDA